jgi:glycine/D-amino acid oxidase-like deaminating enzyme
VGRHCLGPLPSVPPSTGRPGRSTSASSGPASPGSGPPTLLAADPDLRIAVLERRWPASAPRAATAAGARPSSPPPTPAARRTAWTRPCGPCAGPCRRRSTRSAPAADEGDRLPLRQGRDGRGRPHPPRHPGRAEVAEARALGFRRGRPAVARPIRGRGDASASRAMLGATFTPHCAAIQPALLARGLADAVERRGVTHLRAHRRQPPSIPAGDPTRPWSSPRRHDRAADVVVRAVEGWTPTLPGQRRALARLLPHGGHRAAEREFWDEAGLPEVADLRRPPAPDHLRAAHRRRPDGLRRPGGAVPLRLLRRPSFDRHPAVHRLLRRTLVELFPALLAAFRFTHAWGGPLGIPVTGTPRLGSTEAPGHGLGRGYVGDGVATTNLAGRTLADLITGRDTELDPPPLGQSPLTPLGTRAPALAGGQRRAGRSSRVKRWTCPGATGCSSCPTAGPPTT